jgi:hypothetical protein
MKYFLLTLAGLIMAGNARAEGDRVTVRGLNQRLQLTGWQTSWMAKCEILLPIHTLPGGKILAVVKSPAKEPRDLVLWNKDGQELARSRLALAGDVVASRVFDKRLVIASAGEVAEYDTDNLRPGQTLKLPFSSEKTTYFAGPTGLWVVTDRTLSYFDLDGHAPMTRNRPLVSVSDKPACPSDFMSIKAPCSGGFQPKEAEMLVSDTGEMLILDVYLEKYPINTPATVPDQVWPSVVTVLEPRGNIIVQKPYSWMKTKWEWFWSEGTGSQNRIGIGRGGLVRTRYVTDGIGAGRFFTSRGTDFLFTSGSRDTILQRRDSKFNLAWERKLQDFAGKIFLSPSWTSSILLHDSSCYRFSSISDRGAHKVESMVPIREILLEQDATHYERPRFAIGQSSEGDWLLIAY